MWSDIGMFIYIKFFGVAPHWYFRSYMAWLIICSHHYLWVFGFITYFVLLFLQPNLKINSGCLSTKEYLYYKRVGLTPIIKTYLFTIELLYNYLFLFFITLLLYTNTYLPYGRFYHHIGSNFITTIFFIYIYFYLVFHSILINYIFI